MKKYIKFLFVLFILFALASCSGKSSSNYDNGGGNSKTTDVLVYSTDRTIIYRVNYRYESNSTKDEIKEVKNKVREFEGYIESSDDYDTYSKYVYRIPTDKLNDFLDYIDDRDGYNSKTTSTTDVTTRYNYVGNELQELKDRKDAYNAMLQNPDLTLSERMEIESKVDNITEEIKFYEYQAIMQEEDIEYATVTINYSVKENGFVNFLIGLLNYFAITLIIVAPFGVVGLIIFFVLKKKNKKVVE